MADTYTATLRARKIEQGGYNGDWANELNDQCVELLDDAIAGTSAINLGVSTSYSLAALSDGTDSESRAFRLHFTGTPASAVTVTVPASVVGKQYLVHNACGQTLTIKYAATSGVAVLNGEMVLVWCDGTTVTKIDGAPWIGYSPAWTASTTSPTLGNGALTGTYRVHGRSVDVMIELTIGSTTNNGSGEWRFGLPITVAASPSIAYIGACLVFDSGTQWYTGCAHASASGTYLQGILHGSTASSIAHNFPATWATGDVLRFRLVYPY